MKKIFACAFLALLIAVPARAQEVVRDGKDVKMDYTLTVDGKVVDSSKGKKPLEYTQGEGQIISGLEKQMAGMKVGESKTVTVPAKDAYGPVNPNAVQEVSRSFFPADMELKEGMVVPLQNSEGHVIPAKIAEVKKDVVVLDMNHPLAGKDLTFNVTVVGIQ